VSLFGRQKVPLEEQIPHPGRSQLLRAGLGGLIVFALTTGAVATAGLLKVADVVSKINPHGAQISNEGITRADAGSPQTFLILGSDRRFNETTKGNKALKHDIPARSDTMMLLRLDPDQLATTVLSLPRDLKVHIPGHGTDKLNASYSYGGPTLTVKTIKEYTGLQINHVININFGGFRDVVNAIGCVYIDVDRRYYHSNIGLPVGERYAEIDIQPGYQKLCGTDALNYVRYRHNDSDIVRAARQQSFLRQAKDQLNASSLISKRDKLIDIFGRNTQTDKSLKSTAALLSVLKLALFSAGHPVRQLTFPAQLTGETLPGGAVISYVEASRKDVDKTIHEFLHPSAKETEPDVQLTPNSGKEEKPKKPKKSKSPSEVPGLMNGQSSGENVVANVVANNHLGFSIYFPKYITTSSRYSDPPVRAYTLHNRAAKLQHAYRLVLSANVAEGQYWGVEGTDWEMPPILQGTHVVIKRHGRKLGVYHNGKHIHVVSWRRGHAVYWVSNTLADALTNDQILEIASTLTREFH